MTKEFVFDWVDNQPIVCEGSDNFKVVYDTLNQRNCLHLLPKGEIVKGEVLTPYENTSNFVVNMSVCTKVDTENNGEDDVWVEYILTYVNKDFFWTITLFNKDSQSVENESHGKDLF